MMLNLRKTLSAALGLCLGASLVSGQIFWNPQEDEYATVGGDGEWTRTGPGWWDGAENVDMSDNTPVIFEGQGNVTGQTSGNSPRSGNITFQNLTGEYTFSDYILRWGGDPHDHK